MMENQAAKEKGKSAKQDNKTGSKKSGKRKGMSSSNKSHPKETESFFAKNLSVVQGA
jgi:hypothetical protein